MVDDTVRVFKSGLSGIDKWEATCKFCGFDVTAPPKRSLSTPFPCTSASGDRTARAHTQGGSARRCYRAYRARASRIPRRYQWSCIT